MKNFINISDCSSVELRAIIEEAKKRKQNKKERVLFPPFGSHKEGYSLFFLYIV